MNYKEFIKKLKHNELKPVYLFYGEEEYLINYTLKILKDTYIDTSFEALNYVTLNGKEIDFDTIFNACETLPFMADKKIVIIKDLPLFKSKKEEGIISGEWNLPPSKHPLTKYIAQLENYLCLLFVEKEKNIKKSNALYKAINNMGGIVEFSRLRGKDLDIWIQNQFKNYDKIISRSNINYFIQQSSYFDSNRNKTLYDLENEIIKISSYLSKEDEVTAEIIDILMTKPLEMNVFNLLNSISQKDGDNAIKLFNEMYKTNEPVLFILHMIVRQLRNMLKYKVLRSKGYSDENIYIKMKLSRYEYKKVSNESKNFTIPQLERAMEYCLETDRTIKTSSVGDRLALEILLTNLCFKN